MPEGCLYREAEYLLAEDPALADRSLYQTIVAAVATGAARRDDLAGVLGRKSMALEHPLSQLERARFVARYWTATYASRQTLGGTVSQVGCAKGDVAEERLGCEVDVAVAGDGRKSGGRTRLLAIGEAKASDRKRTMSDLDRPVELRAELGRRAVVAGAKILLFGRSGFDDELRREAELSPDVELIDLVRMYEGT